MVHIHPFSVPPHSAGQHLRDRSHANRRWHCVVSYYHSRDQEAPNYVGTVWVHALPSLCSWISACQVYSPLTIDYCLSDISLVETAGRPLNDKYQDFSTQDYNSSFFFKEIIILIPDFLLKKSFETWPYHIVQVILKATMPLLQLSKGCNYKQGLLSS